MNQGDLIAASGSAFFIVFREVMEAGLIIGVVMAATASLPRARRWIFGGVIAGIVGSCLVASCLNFIQSAINGVGEEVFNAAILVLATCMLAWHNIWMASHGRQLTAELTATGKAVLSGAQSLLSMSIVVAVAVMREGSEVVLFLYGVVITTQTSGLAMIPGSVVGLASGALVAGAIYTGLTAIPLRYLFNTLSAIIALLAAGLAAQATGLFERTGMITFWQQTLWDSSSRLPESSVIGKVLHTLVGYSDQPTLLQAIVYCITLAGILIMTRLASKPRHVRPGAAANAPSS